MNYLSYKTVSVNKENANKKWYVVDAEGQICHDSAWQKEGMLYSPQRLW